MRACWRMVRLPPSSMKFLSTWLRNHGGSRSAGGLNMSSMKFLSTWLRDVGCVMLTPLSATILNEVPEHMAQECAPAGRGAAVRLILNEVPEHMAQESWCSLPMRHRWHSSMKFLSTWLRNLRSDQSQSQFAITSSMKFLSTWLRNANLDYRQSLPPCFLNEVPEHMAQE